MGQALSLIMVGWLFVGCQPSSNNQPPTAPKDRSTTDAGLTPGHPVPENPLPDEPVSPPPATDTGDEDTSEDEDEDEGNDAGEVGEEPNDPADESTSLFEPSHHMCQDPGFGKQGLEVCFAGESTLISRFSGLPLKFALRLNQRGNELIKASIEDNLSLKDQSGQAYAGAIFWEDGRTVVVKPDEPLPADTEFKLAVTNLRTTANRPRTTGGDLVRPFTIRLRTKAGFAMTHQVNGQSLANQERSLIIDAASEPTVQLTSTLAEATAAQRIELEKVGHTGTVQLCDHDCPSRFTTNLHNTPLAPTAGLNTYRYLIHTPWDRVEERHVSFIWGPLAADPDAARPGSIQVSLDDQYGFPAVASLLESFIAGDFQLEIAQNGQPVPYRFNDLLQRNERGFPVDAPDRCQRHGEREFTYIGDLGPFCGIPVSGSSGIIGDFGKVNYRARADIYVTSMRLKEDPNNVALSFQPFDDYLGIDLKARQFAGTLKIIVQVDDTRLAGIPVPGTKGQYEFETTFEMDGPPRQALAHTTMQIDQGQVRLSINGLNAFDLDIPLNGDRTSSRFFATKEWSDHVVVADPEPLAADQGLWAQIVNAIVLKAVRENVPTLTPRIVNGIARDMIQVVAPQPLNSILHQVSQGLEIPFPFYLPEPLSQLRVRLNGQLEAPLQFQRSGFQPGFLSSSMQGNLELMTDGLLTAPPAVMGPESYVEIRDPAQPLPKPHTLWPEQPKGPLVAVDANLLNQMLFRFWQEGLFELSIDRDFTRYIEAFAVFDPDKQSTGKEVFLIEFVPKLLGQDIDHLQTTTADGRTLTMRRDDQVSLELSMGLPPVLKLQAAPEESHIPRLQLAAGDVYLTIRGHQGDESYPIVRLKMALSSVSELAFRPYSNPFERDYFNGVGALNLNILSDPDNLDYSLEVLSGKANNPFGLDTRKLERVVQEMVDDLFVPLFNDALREVPLTGLKSCGLELVADQIRLRAAPDIAQSQTLLIEAPIRSYPFHKVCRLKPDFTPPADLELPPIDDEPGSPPPEPEVPSNPGAYQFDMNVDRLPFTIGGTDQVTEVPARCRNDVFFELSCAEADVIYQTDAQGRPITDERGQKIYDYTEVQLFALVDKTRYALRRGNDPSVEGQFFAFDQWPSYVAGHEDEIEMKESLKMEPITIPAGRFERHYVDYAINSPKASGFIPIRNVTLNRVLPQAFTGAQVSTEFFVDTSSYVPTPAGRADLAGAYGIDFHVGNIHVIDCADRDWCGDDNLWLVIYDSRLRPEDTSIPEDVVPYLKSALNAILSGMFP
jgi:hypothetical protein